MRIAHLSDLHLARGPLAAQPAANLADAIGRVLAIEPRPACVVITGDLAGHAHRIACGRFADRLLTVAPSTFRQSALRMHDAEPPGYLPEPTSFLLHLLDGADCVTHSVAISHAAAVRAS